MMPRGSAAVRGEQVAALETEYHALLTTPKVTRLLDRAQADLRGLEDWQVSNLREMRRQRDHAIATPVTLISRLARATALAESQWLNARRDNNFALFAPHLEEVLLLVRDKAALLGQALNLPPVRRAGGRVQSRRGHLRHRRHLQGADAPAPGHDHARRSRPSASGRCFRSPASLRPASSAALVLEVMKAVGFPFDQGRLDESEHPFTEGVVGDIRVTTRYDGTDPFTGLLGALHETGHAMYDLGMPTSWRDQPVGRDRGMALEESQSLLLEMIIGRSAPFLRFLLPLLHKHYGVSGPEWEFENIHRTLTRVQREPDPRGCRRDELPAAHHAALRDREAAAGREARRARPARGMERRAWSSALGVRPTGMADGCLQDMHWALGLLWLLPLLCAGPGHRRAAVGSDAHAVARSRCDAGARRVFGRCSPGSARTCTATGPSSRSRN